MNYIPTNHNLDEDIVGYVWVCNHVHTCVSVMHKSSHSNFGRYKMILPKVLPRNFLMVHQNAYFKWETALFWKVICLYQGNERQTQYENN
jgi:hypothetical protein